MGSSSPHGPGEEGGLPALRQETRPVVWSSGADGGRGPWFRVARGVGGCEEAQAPNATASGDTRRSPQGSRLQVAEGDRLIQVCEAATRKTWGPCQNLWGAAPRWPAPRQSGFGGPVAAAAAVTTEPWCRWHWPGAF